MSGHRAALLRFTLTALICSCVTACGRPSAEPAAGPGAHAPEASPKPAVRKAEARTPESVGTSEDVQSAVALALAETSRVRELAATGPVRGVTLSRSDMAERVRRSIEREVPADVVQAEADVLTALGLVPVAFDYVGAVTKLLGAELAGFYEPSDKTMYVARDLGGQERAATLAHELVHALQDQHYGLGRLMTYEPEESDRQGALHALAEGDATSAMLDRMLRPKGKLATDISDELLGMQVRASAAFDAKIGDVPGVLTRSLIAPYTDGIAFVHWLRRRAGWPEVDRAWKEPPVSTEQVLHPEKFLAREAPISVSAPEVPKSSGLSRTYTDVFGEESLRVVLEEWLPRRAAVDAATGWGGDRVAVFRGEQRVAAAWHLVYDDDAAARRATEAFIRGGESQGTFHRDRTGGCSERKERGPFEVARRGRDIAIVAGPYRRVSGSAESAGSCAAAREWAIAILSGH